MALVATYGDVDHYNIQVYDLSGGGYYAQLCDGATGIWQRRGQAADLTVGGSQDLIDRFTSYSYDSGTSTLTLSGAVDAFNGITYTRQETYRFCAAYVVEDTWSITTNGAGSFSMTNYNVYSTKNIVYNIDNQNDVGNSYSSSLPLGIGMKTTGGSPVYACVADSNLFNSNNNKKGHLNTASGIYCTRVPASGTGSMSLTSGVTVNIRQIIFQCTYGTSPLIAASHAAVATAKGYTGTTFEKVLKTTAYLNQGLMNNLTNVKLYPAENYNYGMWMRDSFWQSFQVNDATEQDAITLYESKQSGIDYHFPLNVLSDLSTTSAHDENTMLYLIRAYYDKKVRGLTVSTSAYTNALTYINNQVTSSQYRCDGTGSETWCDSYVFTSGCYAGYNQGIYCVALKCAKLLGLNVTNQNITDAIAQYQALFDVSLGYIRFTSIDTLLSPDVLVGEALSNFLFNEKMLSSEAVHRHMDRLLKTSMTRVGMKVLCNNDGSFLSSAAFNPSQTAGDYQNGGSWFLYEYLAYLAAYKHGYGGMTNKMTLRNAIELNVAPTSHEYLATAGGSLGSESAARFTYSWNIAYLNSKPSTNRVPAF